MLKEGKSASGGKRLFGFIIFSLFFTNVYAQLQNSAWPMFRHDLQHTGRSSYIGPTTATLKWSYPTRWYIYHSSPAIDLDGTVYFGSWDSTFYAINQDGSLKWSYPTGGAINSSPAIGVDSTIYVGSVEANKLFAINPNGTLKWSYSTGGHIDASPVIGSDGTIYFGSWDSTFYAINQDGSLKWSARIAESPITANAAIGLNNTIYVGAEDFKLYAITDNTTFATVEWSYLTGGAVWSPTIGPDSTIYVGSHDYKFYAFYPNGTVKWSYPTGLYVASTAAIGLDSTIYVGSYDGKLYAFHPNGSLKWSYPTPAFICSSPLIDGEGTIYFGKQGGTFYAIIDSTAFAGTKWTYTTGTIYSSPAIGPDGTVYIGGVDDCKLYAFGPGVANIQEKVLNTKGKLEINSNPVKNLATIKYSLADRSAVSLKIHDITGREVETLVDGEKEAGSYVLRWDSRELKSGIYFITLRTNNSKKSLKVVKF